MFNMEVIKTKEFIPSIIFLGIPFLVLFYTKIQEYAPLDIFVILLSVGWIYLSIEDTVKLSIPTVPLYLVSLLTLLLAFLQKQEIASFFLVLVMIIFIFSIIWIANILTKKRLMGSADFIAIFSFAFTLNPNLIGPWLLLASLIPLIGLISSYGNKSKKLPFIPYLTVSWMVIFIFN